MGDNARWTAKTIMMDGGVVIAMDSGTGNGQQWCKWAVRQRDGSVAMDGTMEGGGSPPRQKRHNGKMDGSGNHDGRQQQDCYGLRQR
jgi:hypothetical protein